MLLLEYFEFVLWNHLFVSLDRGAADWLDRRSGAGESPKPDVGIMLNAARYCLRDEICHEAVWHWVRGLIDKAGGPGGWTGSLRGLLTVYVLCPVLTEPIAWDDPLEMWSMEQILECQRTAVALGGTRGLYGKHAAGSPGDTCPFQRVAAFSFDKPPMAVDEAELEGAADGVRRGMTMNYFAHAVPYLDRPWFVAGTATPDWLAVADRAIRLRSKHAEPLLGDADPVVAELAGGILQHLRDDARFHQSRAFAETSLELTAQVRDVLAGDDSLRPAFLGHLLVELLFDATLIQQRPERLAEYYDVLDRLDARVEAAVNRLAPRPTRRLATFIDLFRREHSCRITWKMTDLRCDSVR